MTTYSALRSGLVASSNNQAQSQRQGLHLRRSGSRTRTRFPEELSHWQPRLAPLVAAIALAAIASSSHAQSSMLAVCKQYNAKGTMHCDPRPSGFNDWTYDTGYGPTAPSEDQSAVNAMNYFTGNRAACSASYTLGAQTVLILDDFAASRKPVRTSRTTTMPISSIGSDGTCLTPIDFSPTIYGSRQAQCKAPYDPYLYWDPNLQTAFCGTTNDIGAEAPAEPAESTQPGMCRADGRAEGVSDGGSDGSSVGHPILPASGEKVRSESDFTDSGPQPLSFTRTYRSARGLVQAQADPSAPLAPRPLGQTWTHNHSAFLHVVPGTADLRVSGGNAEPILLLPATASVVSPEGYLRRFVQNTDRQSWQALDHADTLARLSDGSWTYHRAQDDATLRFDSAGKLTALTERNGWTTTYTYAGALLTRIGNAFGRTLNLAYNAQGLVASVTTPDGRVIAYGYDSARRLASVTYPDGRSRSFVYENAGFPQALTGILDETGVRWGSFAYDNLGRATGTQLAGGVEPYQVSYPQPRTASVTDPLGTVRNYSYAVAQGRLAVTSGSLASGTGQPDAQYRSQDDNGLVTSETDFRGVQTTTTWDVLRRLPVSVTRAVGTAEAQTTTTQWHPTLSLPFLVTASGRSTAFAYDSAGNLLSRRVTDSATNKSRLSQWSYTPQNLVATQTEPNGAVTSFSYDAAGNAVKTVNALGHTTQYAYDNANRIVSATAPNGLVTRYTYDARDRVLSRTVGNLATTFTYNPAGTLASMTLPTGLVLSYTYDAAHRLTGWRNNVGNGGESGAFTLDPMGNRIGEQILGSTGAIAWKTARSINALNRLASQTQGSAQTEGFGYDNNGDLIAQTNGLNQSTRYGLDALRRVGTLTDAASATARLSWNAQDALTEASDFKGVTTNYSRDAQGNATAETSPDIGQKRTQYDALGLPIAVIDAMGQATNITRDALGRPTLITFADGKTTQLAYDLDANGRGYLGRITDRSGTTQYTRDAFGRVTLKRQSLASGLVQQVGYAYAANGLLAAISYPNGSTLNYAYDATGRITQVSVNGKPVLSSLAWNPMGQPTAWTWPFVSSGTSGLAATRTYDTAAHLTGTEFSKYFYDAAGRISAVAQDLIKPGDADPTHTSLTGYVGLWTVAYDPIGRITGFSTNADKAGFSYDPNGNRTGSTRTINGQTTARAYAVDASSNRLVGFNQSMGSSTTNVAYGYNANGDLTSDGLKSFSYNAEGRLSAVTTGATDTSPTTRYAHNALGQRVFKTEPLYPPTTGDESNPGFMQSLVAFFTKLWAPSTTDAERLGFAFMYDEEGNLLSETGTGGANSTGSTQYIYLPTSMGAMPVAVIINGQMFAVHSDHLNTPRKITSSSGQVVWQWSYSAFGEDEPTIGAKRFTNANTVPTTGTTSISPFIFNLRYWGMYVDTESGLFYNGFRSYKPGFGYTQIDPIGLLGGWNRRTTLANNPLSFSDPTGLDVLDRIAYRAAGLRDSSPSPPQILPTEGTDMSLRFGFGPAVTAKFNDQRGLTYLGLGVGAGASCSITTAGVQAVTGQGAKGWATEIGGNFGNGVMGVSGSAAVGVNGSTSAIKPGVGNIGVSGSVTFGFKF